MRVLVTGAGGQLGRELARAAWPRSTEVAAHPSRVLDITDSLAVTSCVKAFGPDVVVNAAAYTSVDGAEDDESTAMEVNGRAVGHLATAANDVGAMLIHLSSDYVFDGTADGWYQETDPVAPLGAYGRSKVAGEEAATAAEKVVTLRTAWVYGALGSNFVTTMLRLAAERDELSVVADQVGCPTATVDLAAAIVQIVESTGGGAEPPPSSLYHLASPEAATWHEFATEIFARSRAGFDGPIGAITTADYPTRAERPANSRLDSSLAAAELGIALPSWRDSLGPVVAELEAR